MHGVELSTLTHGCDANRPGSWLNINNCITNNDVSEKPNQILLHHWVQGLAIRMSEHSYINEIIIVKRFKNCFLVERIPWICLLTFHMTFCTLFQLLLITTLWSYYLMKTVGNSLQTPIPAYNNKYKLQLSRLNNQSNYFGTRQTGW